MPYNVEETGTLARTASVNVPTDEYQQNVDQALRKLARSVKVRGFRKGKVPMHVLRQKYGDSVQQDVIQALVNKYVDEITKETANVLFVDQPRVTGFKENGVGLAFEVAFEVRPALDPIGYLGLAVEKPKIEVEGDAVDEELERLRLQFSTLEPIPLRTSIKEGDVVTFDFEAADASDSELADFKGEGAQITIGEGGSLPGMEEALTGAEFDSTVTSAVEPGDNYRDEKLRGKKFDVKFTVKSVKKRVLPELDDEFAADTGDAETLLELRGKVRGRLSEQQEHSAGHFAENELMEHLLDQNNFELPPLFVRQQIDGKINQQLRQLSEQGMDLQNLNLDIDKIREDLRDETEQQLRAEFLLLAIAEKEKIQVNDEDMNNFFMHQAMHANSSPDQVRRFYQQDQNRWQQATGSALLEKTINYLLDQAEFKEIEWPSEEEQEARTKARDAKRESKKPKAKSEKPKAKPKKPKTKSDKPKAKSEAAEAPDAAAAFSSMKVGELKELLKANDLPVSGKKADLIARLTEAGVAS